MGLGVCLNLSWYQSGCDVCKIRLNNSEKYSVVVTVIQYLPKTYVAVNMMPYIQKFHI